MAQIQIWSFKSPWCDHRLRCRLHTVVIKYLSFNDFPTNSDIIWLHHKPSSWWPDYQACQFHKKWLIWVEQEKYDCQLQFLFGVNTIGQWVPLRQESKLICWKFRFYISQLWFVCKTGTWFPRSPESLVMPAIQYKNALLGTDNSVGTITEIWR